MKLCGIKRTKASLLWATCFPLTRDFCWKPEIQKHCKKSKSQSQTQSEPLSLMCTEMLTQEPRTRTSSNVSVRQSDLKSTRLRSECLRFEPRLLSATGPSDLGEIRSSELLLSAVQRDAAAFTRLRSANTDERFLTFELLLSNCSCNYNYGCRAGAMPRLVSLTHKCWAVSLF